MVETLLPWGVSVACYYIGGDYSSNHYDMYFKNAETDGTWVEKTTDVGQKLYDGADLVKDGVHGYGSVQKTTGGVVAAQKGLSRWQGIQAARNASLESARAAEAGYNNLKSINQAATGANKQVERLQQGVKTNKSNAKNAKIKMGAGIGLGIIGGIGSVFVERHFDNINEGLEKDIINSLDSYKGNEVISFTI